MNKKELTEGLAELAGVAERDHEVQMARADLYKIAKYAIKLHEMLKGVSEAEGMEGWQQSKITKAADYVGSVYHAMDYDNKFKGAPDIDLKAGAGTSSSEVNAAASAQQSSWKSDPSFGEEVTEARDTHCSDKCCGSDVKREDCTCPPTCKHCNCNAKNVDEGKSPHKKGTKKYKKHMAAMHAESDYKEHIRNRLNEALAELYETANTCPECGHAKASDNEQFDEAKQRLDPKCWKGKKIGNPKTKMKGGVRVNNCVPA